MAGITLEQAEAKLAEWLQADSAIATAQSYKINERWLTRADAVEVRKNIAYWNAQVVRLQAGGIRVRGVTPV